jgi:hypothetical protein
MYSENKKKFLIFFFISFFLLAHEGFSAQSSGSLAGHPRLFPPSAL